MATHIERYVAHCGRCIRRKAPDPPRAPMKSFIAKEPMEQLAIDFLSLEKGKGGFENILVVTDSLTKLSWAFPTRDQKATTVAKLLWEKIFIDYGMPQRLHSDRGRILKERSSRVWASLLGYVNSGPHLNTLKGMDRLKDLTRLS